MIYKIAIHGLTNRPLEQFVETYEDATEVANRFVISLTFTGIYITVFVFEIDRYGNVKERGKFSTR